MTAIMSLDELYARFDAAAPSVDVADLIARRDVLRAHFAPENWVVFDQAKWDAIPGINAELEEIDAEWTRRQNAAWGRPVLDRPESPVASTSSVDDFNRVKARHDAQCARMFA